MTWSDETALLNSDRNGCHYDSTSKVNATQIDSCQDPIQHVTTICGVKISQFKLAIVIAVVFGLVNICVITITPIYLTDLVQVGSDQFVKIIVYNLSCLICFTVLVVIRWCHTRELPLFLTTRGYVSAALIGFLRVLHGILMSYASLPIRTRPELLGILLGADLPITVICRYVILRKAVGVKRLLCAASVSVGLFVSLIPEIFGLQSNNEADLHNAHHDSHNSTYQLSVYGTNQSSIHRAEGLSWIWPSVVVLSTLPISLAIIVSEQIIKSPEVSFITLVFWSEVSNCVSMVALFWMALIPNFGMTSNIGDALAFLQRGLYCSYSSDPSCLGCMVLGIMFTFLSPCVDSLMILLTKYADGAIYTTIVMTAFTPLSTIFWTLFYHSGLGGIIWEPNFSISTILAIVGIFIIVPAMCLYAYFSNVKEDIITGKSTYTDKK